MPDLPATRIEPLGRFGDAQPENPRREAKDKARPKTTGAGAAESGAQGTSSADKGKSGETHELDEMA